MGEGVEVVVEVMYEPSEIVTDRAILTIASDTGGSYRCILLGECIAPQPQGPFRITAGGNISIPFKNIFANDMEFLAIVDNDTFTIDWSEGRKTIAAKVETSIIVKCAADGASTGKMQ